MLDGGRRSDSVEFCVREILEAGFAIGGTLRGAVGRERWHLRFPTASRWQHGYTVTPEEQAYAIWSASPGTRLSRGSNAWWAWLAAAGDWQQVSKVVKALGWHDDEFHESRVQLLEDCRRLCGETPHARVINSWLSAHIGWPHVLPSLVTIMDGGTAPDPTAELLSVESKSARRSPLGHLLRKAFPKRCQIRELLRFVSQYWADNIEIEWFIRCAIFCSLGGFYRHHSLASVPCVEARRVLYTKCFGTGPGSLDSWMTSVPPPAVLHDVQCTLLLVLQDTAISVLAGLPSSALPTCAVADWGKFTSLVASAMVAAHRKFDKDRVLHCGRGGARGDTKQTIRNSGNLFFCPTDEAELLLWLRRPDSPISNASATNWSEYADHSGVFSTAGESIYPDHKCTGWGARSRLWDFLVRISAASGVKYPNIKAWLARGFGCAAHRNDDLDNVARLHNDEFRRFCVLLITFRVRHQILYYSLPNHVTTQQRDALRERFKSCPILPSYAGAISVCVYCGDVKNPRANSFSGQRIICKNELPRAYKPPGDGAGAVVFDDDALCIRCNGAARSTSKPIDSCPEKQILTALCQGGRILQIQMTGRLLNFRGKSYALCITCGCFLEFVTLVGSGRYLVCEFCALPPPTACQICARQSHKPCGMVPSTWSAREYIVYGGVASGTLSRGKLCAACLRSLDTKRRRRFNGTDIVCV